MQPFDKKRLLRARKNAGFTQAELAAASGVPTSVISRLESEEGGVEDPRLSTVVKLAKALGTSVGYLVGEGEPKPSRKDRRALALRLVREAVRTLEED